MELWDLYNVHGEKINKTHLMGDELPPETFHLVVVVWIKNSLGQLLIQKRTRPLGGIDNPWATTAGSVLKGESSIQGAIRETQEEMGILLKEKDLNLKERMVFGDSLFDVYEAVWDGEGNCFDPQEVEDFKWVTANVLKVMANKKEFFDYGSEYYRELIK